jgi:hypothetical protein
MLMEIKSINLRIIDSSNFVQGPLKNFPKTFGLKELKKDIFHISSIQQKIRTILEKYLIQNTMVLIL